MSDIAIKAEQLSKYYRLGVINNGTLFRDIQTWIALKRGKTDPHSKIGENKYDGTADGFWALKDLNFEIKQGDRVGIIGKNGAGKSTLLKILSRITAPTEGKVKIKGRVASLLEVGTGFHGELTGRENIYLNGAILGMKKKEVDRKIDEIIDFSGIEKHIDTPVKRYSSGMYVRLAFAVAAHLDSEILIADEVLAVGDAEFQKKAIGKMSELSMGEGRTVLFVSHNMAAVKSLCNKGILLEQGKIRYLSDIDSSIDVYLYGLEKAKNNVVYFNTGRNKKIEISQIRVYSMQNSVNLDFEIGTGVCIDIYYIVHEIVNNTNFSLVLFSDGIEVLHTWDTDINTQLMIKKTGTYITSLFLPPNLNIGKYSISVNCGHPNIGVIDAKEHCISFNIINTNINDRNKSFSRGGILKADIEWRVKKID
ncbi:ABC transporter ATP-binding protein [Treponema sp. OMZ 840]|uniref:ABC transporter ATP-binding protein n=1 Tax=Treponema sp. OMZ 840 TaxID=244313 RepID=UPI003D8C9850